MSKQLPPQSNLRHLKTQAKALLKSLQVGDPDAVERIQASLPRLSGNSEAEILEAGVCLQEAQHVIAREYGFKHWDALQAAVGNGGKPHIGMKREGDAGVLAVTGYINYAIGEKIATACDGLIDGGVTKFVIDLKQCKIVNSRGVSYLIEVMEKVEDLGGSVGFCHVAPTMAKSFKSMGLLQTSSIYRDEEEALQGLALDSPQAIPRKQEAHLDAQGLLDPEEELQAARQLQMSLMPTAAPDIEGFDVAGRCEMANHVGGDFFQYFEQDGRLAICLVEVAGHAMEAAASGMMFSGVLEKEMRSDASLEQLFGHLNRTLHHMLDRRTFVCFCMGTLDLTDQGLLLANAACPYPFHFRAATSEVVELQVDALPLGARVQTAYTTVEVPLKLGDYIVLCSDGIIEAANEEEQMFGFESTAAAISQGCQEGMSAEELIDRLIGAVQAFAGDTPQGDDRTCVVLRIEA